MKPELLDSRRLTGANLHWDLPAAIIDIRTGDSGGTDGPDRLVMAWSNAVQTLLKSVGKPEERTTHRLFRDGASLLVSAPIDALYTMCELNEAAWQAALAKAGEVSQPELHEPARRLARLFEKERKPGLLALQAAAREHGVPFLWDDEEVSVGYGKSALVWAADALPPATAIDWTSVGTIPVALVTGTNGKSTTVRMASSVMAAAGLNAGLTSTDWIRVGETILDTGDYSGTGGARTLLRHPETEMAVLETARGGLLRRGLGVERADAALITNVAEDHLGEYGIDTVQELIEVKFIVRRALREGAPLVLNADDEGIVKHARSLDLPIAWFTLHPDTGFVRRHLADGGRAACLRDGWLELTSNGRTRRIVEVSEIAATMDGAARHNVSNALGATALCNVLGVADTAIRRGLAGFRGDEADNPGRGNWFGKNGIRILVDFAHNEHGVLALADMVGRVSVGRRTLLMGQAGDRTDREIRAMTRAACGMKPDHLMLCEFPGYERGRTRSEVPSLMRDFAIGAGFSAGAISMHSSPAGAAAVALELAKPGDLLVFLALTQRGEVLRLVHEFIDAG